VKIGVESILEAEKIADYLEKIAEGLKEGKIQVDGENEILTLNPEKSVELKIKAKQKEDEEKISIKLKWEKKEKAGKDIGGTVGTTEGEESISLFPEEEVKLEISAAQKKGIEKISFEMSWQCEEIIEQQEFKISSGE